MTWTEYGLAAVLAVPALALGIWALLVQREMKAEEDKKKQH